MQRTDNMPLTLNDIFNSSSIFKSFVYCLAAHFWQATNNPGRLRALLSESIIRCITDKNGDIDNSKAGSIMKKEMGTKSHSVKRISERIYNELVSADFRVITEEEKHLQIALSQCAYVLALDDPLKWVSASTAGVNSSTMIKRLYEGELSRIKDFSTGGKELAEQIKASMLDKIGPQLIRHCHLLDQATDNKKPDAKQLLLSINASHLLTAAIIIAINYQNMGKDGTQVSDLDPLTKHIRQYLKSDVGEDREKKSSADSDVLSKPALISNSSKQSDTSAGGSQQPSQNDDPICRKVLDELQNLISASTFQHVETARRKVQKALELYISTRLFGPFADNISDYSDGTPWRIQKKKSLLWLNNELGKCMSITSTLEQTDELRNAKMVALNTITEWDLTLLLIFAELTLEQQALEICGTMLEKENRQKRIIKLRRDYAITEIDAETADNEFRNMIDRYQLGLTVDKSTM